MEFFDKLFQNDFMPHGHCYFWEPGILWMNVIGDSITAFSYYLIPLILLVFIKKRQDIKFRFIFAAFALFIVACGTTHIIAVVSVWNPYYRIEGLVKVITAVVSIGTVFLLIKNFPQILNLPTPEQLLAANASLKQEINNRRKVEDHLRRSEQKFRMAMHFAPIGKALVGLDGKWLEVNKSLCNMLGYTAEELLQTDFQSLTYAEDLNMDLEYVGQLLAGKIKSYQMEKRYIHKSGNLVWGLLSVSLPRDENGDPVHFIAQIQDITQKKLAEQKILDFNRTLEQKVEKRTQELQEVNRELETFAYTVTHDLRSPLRSITGLVDVIKEDYQSVLDDEGAYMMQMIGDNVEKLDHLIIDLLKFSRAKKVELKKEHFEMKELILEAIEELKPGYSGKEIALDLAHLPSAYGDKNVIKQVCSNLMSNALKYSSKNERIAIKVGGKKANNSVIYWIKDNGVGFDDSKQHKLFTIFQRLHTQEEFKGTGVGLAICKTIIHKHGGKIWAESQVGKGSSFYFSLPNARH